MGMPVGRARFTSRYKDVQSNRACEVNFCEYSPNACVVVWIVSTRDQVQLRLSLKEAIVSFSKLVSAVAVHWCVCIWRAHQTRPTTIASSLEIRNAY